MMSRLIIFSGYNQRAVIALLRVMKAVQIPFGIVAAGNQDSIFETEYRQDVIEIRSNSKLELEEFIPIFKKIGNRYPQEKFIIAPSTEALNRFFLKNRKVLNECGFTLPLVSEDLYLQLSDKKKFQELCESWGILTPTSFSKLKDCPEAFVAKPISYVNGAGEYLSPVLIKTEAQRSEFIKNYHIDDFYFQEYLEGESYYLLYYFGKEQRVEKFSQKNLLQQAEGKSILSAEPCSLHKEEISEKYEKMLKGIGFRGLIMIEVRKTEKGYYMIEANPRMWGPLQLCVDAKTNILPFFLHDWGLLSKMEPWEKPDCTARYCWFGGIKENLSNGKNISVLSNAEISWKNLLLFFEHDIYCRKDTMKIFESE